MKKWIVTARAYGTVKRFASWELSAESEIVAMQTVKTRDELLQWPCNTIWECKEVLDENS